VLRLTKMQGLILLVALLPLQPAETHRAALWAWDLQGRAT
jgi:hypothetical protein